MLRGIVARAAVCFAIVGASHSIAQTVNNVSATLERSWTRQADGTWEQSYGSEIAAIGPQGQVYQNNTTFGGTGATQGPGGLYSGPVYSNIQTSHVMADDLTLDPAAIPGTNITFFQFTVGNFNSVARTVRPHVSFYLNDGPGGQLGTIVSGFLFNPVNVPANTVSSFSFTPGLVNQWSIPANRFFWAAMSFDRGGTSTASNAELDNFGQGFFNPPTIGSSQNLAWFSTDPHDGFTDNPLGNTFTAPNDVTNFGWELRVAIPEPTGMAVIAAGGFVCVGRRRRSR